jgi:archaemetzincin
MGPVMFGDWLSIYPEKGQSFSQYLASRPNVPEGKRRVLYVRPLGSFTPAQTRIVELTAEYLEQFYGLPARIAPPLAITGVPAGSHRTSKITGTEQIQTGYLLNLLKDYLPDDAFAEIGLIATDLYPDEKMNFVFGQATLRDRVGVWSLHWLGEPDKSRRDFQETLLWTLKIASHETGHMFSIPHCAKYQCVMDGSNSLYEVDRHPLDTCPECMAKICWATRSDPGKRFERLAAFFARQGLPAARLSFERPLKALEARQSKPAAGLLHRAPA